MEEQQLLIQIKSLQDELVNKEEESYVTISNLKEENSRLLMAMQLSKKNSLKSGGDREVAKLSVENEFLKNTIAELETKLKNFESTSALSPQKDNNPSKRINTDYSEGSESEMSLMKDRVKALREENI